MLLLFWKPSATASAGAGIAAGSGIAAATSRATKQTAGTAAGAGAGSAFSFDVPKPVAGVAAGHGTAVATSGATKQTAGTAAGVGIAGGVTSSFVPPDPGGGSITYPVHLLPTFPGWTIGFDLRWRQEQSTQASGRVIVKDMGAPLWTMRAVTKVLAPNALDTWRARLMQLENGLQTFWGYPMSRCYPIKHPNASWPTGGGFVGTCTLATINANRKAITLSGLPYGFELSVGDYISINGDLHQVMVAVSASVTGVTPEFEVRPHIWPGVTPPKSVSVKQPACLMAIMPGSISSDADLSGRGTISFSAMEARL